MNKIKKGSSVVKKAGNKEIVFVVEKIFSEKRKKIAILKGLLHGQLRTAGALGLF